LEIPTETLPTSQQFHSLIRDGIELNKDQYKDQYIKLYVTGGSPEDGISITNKPNVVLLFFPSQNRPEKFNTTGIKLIKTPFERFIPEVKYTNYLSAVIALNRAKEQKADEVLFLTNDSKYILEGTTHNFFGIKGNKIITPHKNILEGTTRNHLINLLKAKKSKEVQVEVRDVKTEELNQFDEAFITSTTKEVCPVVQVDQKVIGNGKIGKVTKLCIELFEASTKI